MKLRRFHVLSLSGMQPGSEVMLATSQAQHARVLRLKAGDEVEVFDEKGWVGRAELMDVQAGLVTIRACEHRPRSRALLRLAVPWPKGKRAALLIEKCTELEVDEIIPLRTERSIVSKDAQSEGMGRLKRIAEEAAKQCGRPGVPRIAAEQELGKLLETLQPATCAFVLDPSAETWISSALEQIYNPFCHKELMLILGPEGGLSERELSRVAHMELCTLKVASYVLRVETAALAGCAITRAFLGEHF